MQTWPFITWCSKNKVAVAIVAGILSAFGLMCIKYPFIFDKVAIILMTILVGMLVIAIGILQIVAATWLCFVFPYKIGWVIGLRINLFNDMYNRFDYYGPAPWFIGIFSFGIPIGAYFLGSWILEMFTH